MKIDGNYLVLEDKDIINDKKIKGHAFVELLGLNPFKKSGDALLEHCGLLPSDEVLKKWLLRGDFAEKVVKKTYEKYGRTCTTYDKVKIGWDNFHENENFGGLIDIELLLEKTLIEVKSKNIKDYMYIINKQPKHEVYQGMLYAYLRGYKSFIMEYIFFDDETEKEIFEGRKPTTLSKLKRFYKIFDVEYEIMTEYMQICLEKIEEFKLTRKIDLKNISDTALEKLGLLNKDVDISDVGW